MKLRGRIYEVMSTTYPSLTMDQDQKYVRIEQGECVTVLTNEHIEPGFREPTVTCLDQHGRLTEWIIDWFRTDKRLF